MDILDIQLDIDSLTLGEMMEAEDASGQDIAQLLARSGHRRTLAVFVHQLRSSGKPPDWKSLGSLKVRGSLPSDSASSPDGGSMASGPLEQGISPTS